jgi:hypothetical protein
MINIFFVPGMFGSTVEYVLRSFTKEHVPVESAVINDDGSMHSFSKQFHPKSLDSLDKFVDSDINTPIYPFKECHLPEILKFFQTRIGNGKSILIYADSLRSAELNILFQYYKIAFGKHIKLGLEIFAGKNDHNIINWNPEYKNWIEMKPWEFREWFSLFYVSWVQEWIESPSQVSDTFLKIKNIDILYDTKNTFLKIINFCNLTVSKELDSFVDEWTDKQKYIVNEFDLLDKIMDHTVNNQEFNWKPISIVSEAIIQQRLRTKGYEIRCDGLNTFPVDSKTLYSLLEKC